MQITDCRTVNATFVFGRKKIWQKNVHIKYNERAENNVYVHPDDDEKRKRKQFLFASAVLLTMKIEIRNFQAKK